MEAKTHSKLYENKLILGPMVRVGTLPMRLLALENGADLVYTEEIIDFKLIKSKRFVNDILGTVDFIDDSGVVVFRTCSKERDRVILQIGTNDAERAVLAAKMIENDVAGVDVNMGCPKSFSLKGGMGAALMSKPNLVQQIIRSLKSNIRKPISCKIRVFDDLQSTLNLLKLIEESGADAVAIHGRTKEERPRHRNRNDYIRAGADFLTIPVIANGDSVNLNSYENIRTFQRKTHAQSVMISRAAMKNCSIFDRSNKMKEVDAMIVEYLMLAIQYDNNAINTKYCIQQMLGSLQEFGRGKLLMTSYDHKTMSEIYQLGHFYQQVITQWAFKKERLLQCNHDNCELFDKNYNHIELPVLFDKTLFNKNNLPKTILNKWILENGIDDIPRYETSQIEKQFHSVVSFMGKTFTTPYLEKNKRSAEQAAALVIIFQYGLCDNLQIRQTCLLQQPIQNTIKYECQGRTYLIKINK